MAVSREDERSQPPGETRGDIEALFQRCERRQNTATPSAVENLRTSLMLGLRFGEVCPTAPDVNSPDFLISQGHVYQHLVALLRGARHDKDKFWYVLAAWLRSEDLIQPDRLLPKDVFERLTKGYKARLNSLSVKDHYNSFVIRTWLPYTEPLVRKAGWLKKRKEKRQVLRPAEELNRLGYALDAAELATSKTWVSAVEFTCEWLAPRLGVDAPTLRNAYSRVVGGQVTAATYQSCSFCKQPAKSEFWANGDPVPVCNTHKANKLPTSKTKAWFDHSGRRWWREDIIVCQAHRS
jgi:hypothetical protein